MRSIFRLVRTYYTFPVTLALAFAGLIASTYADDIVAQLFFCAISIVCLFDQAVNCGTSWVVRVRRGGNAAFARDLQHLLVPSAKSRH